MKVKELIEILKDYPQEAEVSFKVGYQEDSQDLFAKLQLMTGAGLSCLRVVAIESWREYSEECPEHDGLLAITLVDSNYDHMDWVKYENQFNSLTKKVKFPPKYN